MKTIDEYKGQGLYDNRRAVIQENGDKYFVDLYIAELHLRTVDTSEYALRYAEDTAENWVTGIIKE
jgi:hypothetical protein